MELSINASMGERIRYYRQAAGLTQKQLAEACGLSEPAIRNYELGNRYPDMETLTTIAAVLEVSVFALSNPDLTANFGAVHALFRMEQIYDLHPVEVDGQIMLALPKIPSMLELLKDPSKVFDSSGTLLAQSLRAWEAAYRMYVNGEIDEETYIRWKAKYPEHTDALPEPTAPAKEKKAKRMRKPKAK